MRGGLTPTLSLERETGLEIVDATSTIPSEGGESKVVETPTLPIKD